MKNASAATLAIIATRQAVLAELYQITLTTGQTYYLTSAQIPLTAAVYPSATKNVYGTGLTITRDSITQKVGVEAGSMKLTLTPQWDSPFYPVNIASYPIQQAARLGLLDGATIQLSKLFMNRPTPGNQIDTSPGAVAWYVGTVQEIEIDRFTVELTVDDYLAYLGNQQMPRQLYQVGCWHNLFDAGCTLLRSAFTTTSNLTAVTDAAHFTASGLTQAAGYFNQGIVKCTSGVNAGQQVGIASHAAGGVIVARNPFSKPPGVGDTHQFSPGCDKQQGTCSSKFANLAHFSGYPYIPTPETVTDGATDNPPAQTPGAQAGQIVGSGVSMNQTRGPFKT